MFSAALGSLLSLPFEAAWLQPGAEGPVVEPPYPPPPAPAVRAWWEADWKAGRPGAGGAAGISLSWEEKPWAHLLVSLCRSLPQRASRTASYKHSAGPGGRALRHLQPQTRGSRLGGGRAGNRMGGLKGATTETGFQEAPHFNIFALKKGMNFIFIRQPDSEMKYFYH